MERFTLHSIRLATATSAAVCMLGILAGSFLQASEIVLPFMAGAEQSAYSVQQVSHCDSCAPTNDCSCGSLGCAGDCHLGGGCAGGCGDDACCGCAASDCCHSFWTVRANGLYMQREQPDSLVLMQDSDTVNPTRTLNARDFDFDYQGGYELALIGQPQCGWGFEARFMSVQDFSASANPVVNTSMADPLQINTIMPTFVQDVTVVNADYESGFHSFEFNLRRECCDIALLIGFRYFELDEQLAAGLIGASPGAIYNINTQNRMYGIQAGAEGTLARCGQFRLDALAKGGLYYNAARQHSAYVNGVINQQAIGEADEAAFMGELGLMGVYDFTSNWSLRFGYQGLWLDSVALASDQIPATDLFNQTGIDSEGGTFYHGGVLGLEFRR